MTLRALTHVYPAWQDDPHHPDGPYSGESRLVYTGLMRIVHSRKRMRLLRRRGVPMMHLGYGDGTAAQQARSPLGSLVRQGPWAWFEDEGAYAVRYGVKLHKSRLRSLRHINFEGIEARVHAALVNHGYHIDIADTKDKRNRCAPHVVLTYIDASSNVDIDCAE